MKNSSNNISIIKLKLNDGCFIINEEYNFFEIENNKENDNDCDSSMISIYSQNLSNLNIIYNNGTIILWGGFLFLQ